MALAMAIILHLLLEFLAEDKILANIFPLLLLLQRASHMQVEGSSESLHCSILIAEN